ncbi:MAG TPA: glycosyltransferase family 39 protein [Candidatus Binatia bacterium]|nr:glycosyltransferase family 39 protein [Candidatus Binatia bacterium]
MASPAGAGGRDRILLAVAGLSLVLNTAGIGWGLPPSGYFAWDVDGIAPLQPLVAAKRMFVDDWWNSGYYNKFPMGHFFLLMAAYAPYLGYLWLTGGLRDPSEVYPFGFSDPATALTVLSLIARSFSALMGVGIVILVYLIVRRAAGPLAALFSALAVAFSPAFIFYAHTGNVDTPSIFWATLALFALGRLVGGRCDVSNAVLLGGAVGMAAATKEQTLGLFLLLPLSALALYTQHTRPAPRPPSAFLRAAADRALLAGATACLATFVVATHLIFNWEGNVARLRWRLQKVHPTYGTEYPRSVEFSGLLDGLGQVAFYTWDALNPALCVAGLVGLAVLPLRHRWARHFAIALASYAGLTVAMLDYFRARFVMEVALVLALFAGPVLAAVWTAAPARRLLRVSIVLLGLYSFAYGAEIDYLLLHDARYGAEAWLQRGAPPGTTVEVYTGSVYLPRFPPGVTVDVRDFTAEELERLPARAPDLVVLTSVHYERLEPGSVGVELLDRLLGGELGYRTVEVFRTAPVIAPRIIAALSPEVVVLARQADERRTLRTD